MSGQTFFNTQKDYLKRHPASGSTTVAAPSVQAAWFNYVTTYTVPHNLGYIPLVRVYYEPYSNGKIYPATGSRISGFGPGLSYGDIICLWEIDNSNLTIYVESANSHTGTVPIYWVIYWDTQ